ncbi:hypothetical protein [Flavobacterium sp.]|jgi:hypothetical protein|uniref:hypothetical protein n=1 Tax=Flavobacterium sp. TaxID=239 RepID=UPI0037C10B8C
MEANSNKNSEAFNISGGRNNKSNSINDKFSHITETNLKLEQEKEEQWTISNDLRVYKNLEEVKSNKKKYNL